MLTSIASSVQALNPKPSEKTFARALILWYRKQDRKLPWRERFAATGDPFAVWVSEIMLQQTTIQAVLPAYARFFETFPDIVALAKAEEEEVRLACRGLGYYRRFRFLHQAAQELVRRDPKGHAWPKDFKTWRELPGIGDYTAAAISSIAFGYAKGVVDGNVERVLCRLLDLRVVVDASWKRSFQKVVDALIDPEAPGDFNQAFMELGQTVCTKQNPDCSRCPLHKVCQAAQNQSQHLAPQPKPPMAFEDVSLHLWILEHKGKIGLATRHDEARFLKGSLGFPTAHEGKRGRFTWDSEVTCEPSPMILGPFRHSITKHKIEAKVHLYKLSKPLPELEWTPHEEVETRLLANLDRKAWKLYEKHRTRLDPQLLA